MSYEESRGICEYIMTHAPQATEFETIDAAIRAVILCHL